MSVIENQEIGPLTKKLKNHDLIVLGRVTNGIAYNWPLDAFEKDCLESINALIQTLKNYNNVKGDE